MRGAIALLILALVLGTCSCDTVFVGGFLDIQRSVSGTVSLVHLSVIDGNVQVTVVTLVQSQGQQDFRFCGNLTPQFPMNADVTVNFTPGTTCNSNVAVIVRL